jgi:hypothetical protein
MGVSADLSGSAAGPPRRISITITAATISPMPPITTIRFPRLRVTVRLSQARVTLRAARAHNPAQASRCREQLRCREARDQRAVHASVTPVVIESV